LAISGGTLARLQLLVDVEEVLYLASLLLDRLKGGVAVHRVVHRDAQHLGVTAGLVLHQVGRQRPDTNAAAREGGLGHEHDRVERIAVLGQRVRKEAVVRGIARCGEQPPVEENLAGLVVHLVLVAAPAGNLDNDNEVGGHAAIMGDRPASVRRLQRPRQH
jgi:hypothetical protein